MLAYRTENANRIKRKEKRKMDVINILINPSEKAKCGHGAMLTTAPPGAAAGGRLGKTRATGPSRRARPGAAASPRCDWRNRTSSSTRSSCIVFFGPSPFASRIRWSPLWNLKAEAVRAANGKHYHKHDDALCVMFSEMHRTLLGMPFRSKRRMKYEESLDKARGAKALKVSSRLGL